MKLYTSKWGISSRDLGERIREAERIDVPACEYYKELPPGTRGNVLYNFNTLQRVENNRLGRTVRKYSGLHWLVPAWSEEATAHVACKGVRLCDKKEFPVTGHFKAGKYDWLNMVHEERTPLGVLRQYGGYALRHCDVRDESDEYVKRGSHYARPICPHCLKVLRVATRYLNYRACSIYSMYLTWCRAPHRHSAVLYDMYWAAHPAKHLDLRAQHVFPAHNVWFSPGQSCLNSYATRALIRDLEPVLPKALRQASQYKVVAREHPGYDNLYLRDMPFLYKTQWTTRWTRTAIKRLTKAGYEPTLGNLYRPEVYPMRIWEKGIGGATFKAVRNLLTDAGYPDLVEHYCTPTELIHKSANDDRPDLTE